MRIGVYGGTFNPIHRGHVQLALSFLKALSLDKVLVIPANTPPHKRAAWLLPGEARLNLCRLACEKHPELEVSDLELRRSGNSYTVDTLRELSRQYPGAEFFLIVGSDMFLTMESWRESEEIFRMCRICTGARREGELSVLHEKGRELERLGAQCVVLDLPVFDISSTELRRAVGFGADKRMLVRWIPTAAAEEILRQGYYAQEPETDEQYLKCLGWIRETLGEYRLFHSRCVAQAAQELAERYFPQSLDSHKAKLAGLLHDICKDMPKEEQCRWMEYYGPVSDPLILHSPSLWHGFAGASYLRKKHGVSDEDFLNAVRYHTTARKDMSQLEQVVYLADYISMDRDYPDVEKMRAACRDSVLAGMRYSLRYTLGMLSGSGRVINRDTWEAYNEVFGTKESI